MLGGGGVEVGVETEAWLRAAMSDDSLAAEMLIRLSQPVAAAPAVAPLRWGLRQPRSKQITRSVTVEAKNEEVRRASPTTPLSFSGGGTSPSGGYGCVESSRSGKRPAYVDGASKVVASEVNTFRLSNRRTRKKKTFAELKEEENLLMMEKMELNEELESMQIAFKELRDKNESLKKLKLSLQPQSDSSCETLKADIVTSKALFMLPDLNLPVEDDSGSETLYGMS
ncbi:uncharacterized protein LOC143879497 [Tasmannia lanceolata]|uniref:uncharacterized protein LOC143879497 n=1 Tax=Tasmannia lanceolata TaxID=3420 RepID=UPI0040629CB9